MNAAKRKEIIGNVVELLLVAAIIMLIIVESSKSISIELKTLAENSFFIGIILIVIFSQFYNLKDKPDLDDLEVLPQPVEPYHIRLAERLTIKKNRIESLVIWGSLIYFIGLFYSYRTHDDRLFALMIIWALPIAIIPLTWHMLVNLKLQKVKVDIIQKSADNEKLLKPSGRILVDYVVFLIVITNMWLGGFEMLDPIGYPFWIAMIQIAMVFVVLMIKLVAWLMNYKAPDLPKEE